MTLVTLTERAAEEIKRTFVEQDATPDTIYLRMAVAGGGCAGFTRKLFLDEDCNPEKDHLEEHHGIRVVIDKRSALYLDGTTVDYHEDLNKQGFTFSNPAVKGSCSCGSSFSL